MADYPALKMFINGNWRDAVGRASEPLFNPSKNSKRRTQKKANLHGPHEAEFFYDAANREASAHLPVVMIGLTLVKMVCEVPVDRRFSCRRFACG